MPRATDDTTLRARLVAGGEEAFEAVYDRFAARLLATAWGLLGSRDDAEDTVQDVFLGLVRSRATLATVENLEAYLFTSLRHAAIRRWRKREGPPLGLLASPDCPPTSAAVPLERAERLERALAALPAEQREVVALKIDGGLTLAEIAAVLETNPNTVASRYRYALENLRDRLKE